MHDFPCAVPLLSNLVAVDLLRASLCGWPGGSSFSRAPAVSISAFSQVCRVCLWLGGVASATAEEPPRMLAGDRHASTCLRGSRLDGCPLDRSTGSLRDSWTTSWPMKHTDRVHQLDWLSWQCAGRHDPISRQTDRRGGWQLGWVPSFFEKSSPAHDFATGGESREGQAEPKFPECLHEIALWMGDSYVSHLRLLVTLLCRL